MKNIIITGGAGLIGSNLARRLRSTHNIVIIDNLWRGKLDNIRDLVESSQPGFGVVKFINTDLSNYSACLEHIRNADCVYHLADIVAGINFVFSNEYSLFRQHLLINTHVLKATIVNKIHQYIYVGTACSFPLEKQQALNAAPLKEEDTYPAHPESSYGWSKLMGEYEAELVMKKKLVDVGILRFHNVYGPPCELSAERSQVIPALCRKAIRYPAEDFIVWGSGNQRRAFVYVDDVVDALVSVRERGMNQGVIQIGPSQSVSVKEIAELLVKCSGKNIAIEYDRSKPEGDKDRMADFTKARAILGWQPTTPIEVGLRKTYEWCERYLVQSR